MSDELEDIRLNNGTNKEIKKKYIVLSIALIILFILTIVIIRLISSDKKDEATFLEKSKVEAIKKDHILDTLNEEKYQKIIDKKAKKIIQKKLDLSTITQEEIPLPEEKSVKDKIKLKKEKISKITAADLFDMEKKKTTTKTSIKKVSVKKEQIKKEITKKVQTKRIFVKQPIVEKILTKKVQGFYIQVGAFSKQPSKILLANIKKNNFDFVVYQMKIKGILYNKVLIGSYKNRKEATKMLAKIRKLLNKPRAYILKIK
jgi:DedD protein